jgi:threonine synthase
MSHKEHKEFNESVLRHLCEEAGKTLPAVDPSAAWETKAEIVLSHLKNKGGRFLRRPKRIQFSECQWLS